MNYGEAYYELVNSLQPLYDAQEASAIAHEVMNELTGQDKLQRLVDKDKLLTNEQEAKYGQMFAELGKGRPLQYVLGCTWFLGKKYLVNEHVLIPRPETEELVSWVIEEVKGQKINSTVLDIGTGSGCIPISLKLALKNVEVSSCDISSAAIHVAKENSDILGAQIDFKRLDFLESSEWKQLGSYDIIVSNPPYIPISEMNTLHINVRNYEPAAALFVEGDALLFYRAIAEFGKTHLKTNGVIYFETHADHAIATKETVEQLGYSTELRKDMHGNYRMLKAWPSSST